MKRIIAVCFAAFALAMSMNAQDNKQATNVTVTAPRDAQNQTICSTIGGGRYEIVTSGISGHKRYRLDKTTGEVWIFYGNADYRVIQREPSDKDIVYDDEINYQLYIMGDGSNAYLINLNTGVIWFYEVHLFKADQLKLMKQSM